MWSRNPQRGSSKPALPHSMTPIQPVSIRIAEATISNGTRLRKSAAQGEYPASLLASTSGKRESLDPSGQISKQLWMVVPFLFTVSTSMFVRSDLDVRAECSEGP